MIRIEFIGIPGAGKSTLHAQLVSNLKNSGAGEYLSVNDAFYLVARKEMDKIFRLFLHILPVPSAQLISDKLMNRSLFQFEAQGRFLSRHGESFGAFVSSPSYRKLPMEDRANLIDSYLQVGGILQCIRDGLPGRSVVLFDEGLVQKSFMFVSENSGMDENWLSVVKYLEYIPLPEIVVCIDPPLHVCLERMYVRAKGLTNRMKRLGDQSKIDGFIRRAQEHLRGVVEWLRKNSGTQIIEVVNDCTPGESLPAIARKVISFSQACPDDQDCT